MLLKTLESTSIFSSFIQLPFTEKYVPITCVGMLKSNHINPPSNIFSRYAQNIILESVTIKNLEST
jgi:hypothetical protein